MAKRLFYGFMAFLAIAIGFLISGGGISGTAFGQVAYTVESAGGENLHVTLRDQSRPDNTIVLYTPEYGPKTRTNPYGVEVIAEETKRDGEYVVRRVTSVFECQKGELRACGNAEIPAKGIVLSASGAMRSPLLEALRPGDPFVLRPQWFQSKTVPITVINPNMSNNAPSCGFPGCRGGNQMVIYNRDYGKPKTGTNEFGFEVTVVDGMVVAHEGADSTIPETGYVISGHGKARDWLVANAPLGARISVNEDGTALTSTVDVWTYRYQLARRIEDAQCTVPVGVCRGISDAEFQIEQLQQRGRDEDAAQLAVAALEGLNKSLWKEYPSFDPQAVRAIWHRPVETSRHDVIQTLEFLQESGINTVYLETFFHGYTIFPSETYRAYDLPAQYPKFAPAGDLLQIWIDEAHQRDIKVGVWFQTFYAGNRQAYNGSIPDEGPILSKYPDWANIQYSAKDKSKLIPSTLESGGYFLDPANPRARGFLLQLAEEIVRRYDVDAFQLDYIRYPASFPPDRFSYISTTWGYTPSARWVFKERTGFDPADFTKKGIETDQYLLWQQWNQFKVGLINDFVRDASTTIRDSNPKVRLSAVIFPGLEESMVRKHQDWATWAVNGWVDYLAPITLTSAIKVVEEDTQRVARLTQGKVPVISGVFGPFNNNTAEHMLDQIEAARVGGASGFAIFDTAHFTGRMSRALSASQGKKSAFRQGGGEHTIAPGPVPAPGN